MSCDAEVWIAGGGSEEVKHGCGVQVPRHSRRRNDAIDLLATSQPLEVGKHHRSTNGPPTYRDESFRARECACKALDSIVGADMDAKELRRRQKSNQAVARCIPVLLICAVVYASWVFVGPLCGEQAQDGRKHLAPSLTMHSGLPP
jgi:hypothetical protein